MDKEEKRQRKEYKQMIKSVRKKLKKASEEFCPWDEGYLFNYMRIIFECWRDYYSLGWNVSGMDVCEWNEELKEVPTRKRIAAQLLRLMDDMDNSWDDLDVKETKLDDTTKALFDYMAKYIHFMWD